MRVRLCSPGGDARPDGDVDVTIEFVPDATQSLFEIGHIKGKVEQLLVVQWTLESVRRWVARHADTDLAVSKALDRIDAVRAEARAQAVRERRKGRRA